MEKVLISSLVTSGKTQGNSMKLHQERQIGYQEKVPHLRRCLCTEVKALSLREFKRCSENVVKYIITSLIVSPAWSQEWDSMVLVDSLPTKDIL